MRRKKQRVQHHILIRNSWPRLFFFKAPSFCFHLLCWTPARGIPDSKEIQHITQDILQEQCRIDGLAELSLVFELSILLCNDKEITKLNQKYRNKKEATDVLSFPLIEFPQGPGTSQKTVARKILEQNPRILHRISHEDFFYQDQKIEKQATLFALGDIVISCPSCIRQAKAKGIYEGIYKGRMKRRKSNSQLVQAEFIRLLIHGILHLFGYDHEGQKQHEIRMRAREKLLYKYVTKTKARRATALPTPQGYRSAEPHPPTPRPGRGHKHRQ